METILMNRENSKTNESYTFALNLSQRLDLRSSNKYLTFQDLPIFYLEKYQKTVKKQWT